MSKDVKLNQEKLKKAFSMMSEQHQQMYKKLMTHSKEFVVDKKPYIATADHIENELNISLYGVSIWKGSLDHYTNFSGNMQRFVEVKARVKCH
jgi:hypothetical protein